LCIGQGPRWVRPSRCGGRAVPKAPPSGCNGWAWAVSGCTMGGRCSLLSAETLLVGNGGGAVGTRDSESARASAGRRAGGGRSGGEGGGKRKHNTRALVCSAWLRMNAWSTQYSVLLAAVHRRRLPCSRHRACAWRVVPHLCCPVDHQHCSPPAARSPQSALPDRGVPRASQRTQPCATQSRAVRSGPAQWCTCTARGVCSSARSAH
jgi:hypothetical protein